MVILRLLTRVSLSLFTLAMIVSTQVGMATTEDAPSEILRQKIIKKLADHDLAISGPHLQALELVFILRQLDIKDFVNDFTKEDLQFWIDSIQRIVDEDYSSDFGKRELQRLYARYVLNYNNPESSAEFLQKLIVTYLYPATSPEIKDATLERFRRMVKRNRSSDN